MNVNPRDFIRNMITVRKNITLFVLVVFVALCGCSRTTVHLHTSYFPEEERDTIRSELERQGFTVEVRDNEFPFTESIILYHPHAGIDKDLNTIDKVLADSGVEAGHSYVVHTQKLGMHEYTAGNIGVYIVGGGVQSQNLTTSRVRSVFPLTLIGDEFVSVDCDQEYAFEFFDDGRVEVDNLSMVMEASSTTTWAWETSSENTVVISNAGERFEYTTVKSHREHLNQRNDPVVTYTLVLEPMSYYRLPFGCHYKAIYFETF